MSGNYPALISYIRKELASLLLGLVGHGVYHFG
jgi:hypothetical protein